MFKKGLGADELRSFTNQVSDPYSEDMPYSRPYIPKANEPESFLSVEPYPYYFKISNIAIIVPTNSVCIQVVPRLLQYLAWRQLCLYLNYKEGKETSHINVMIHLLLNSHVVLRGVK